MATLLDLSSRLTGQFPGLSSILAETFVQDAWAYIRGKRNWFFLSADSYFVCPTVVTTGTIAITQYLDTVTLDADASAALLAQVLASTAPTPGAVQPGITNLQIRFGQTSPSAGQIYSIIAADPTDPTAIVLTLNRVVVEATNPTSGYQVYRCYITPPAADFLKFESIVSMSYAMPIGLGYSSAQFDLWDPQRTSQGQAVYCGRYETGWVPDPVTQAVIPNPNINNGAPMYELWPAPTQGETFYTRYRRAGTDLPTLDDAPPDIVQGGLILTRAMYHDVYPYIRANQNNFPAFKGLPLTELSDRQKRDFDDMFMQARRADEEQNNQAVISRGHGLRTSGKNYFKGDGPLVADANWLQSHLVRF